MAFKQLFTTTTTTATTGNLWASNPSTSTNLFTQAPQRGDGQTAAVVSGTFGGGFAPSAGEGGQPKFSFGGQRLFGGLNPGTNAPTTSSGFGGGAGFSRPNTTTTTTTESRPPNNPFSLKEGSHAFGKQAPRPEQGGTASKNFASGASFVDAYRGASEQQQTSSGGSAMTPQQSAQASAKKAAERVGSGPSKGLSFVRRSSKGGPLSPRAKGRSPPFAATAASALKRRSSSTSVSQTRVEQCTALKLMNVPKFCNNQQFLQKHYRPYGEVERVACKIDQNVAVVEFDTHEHAKRAKQAASVLKPGTRPVRIAWVMPSFSDSRPSVSAEEGPEEGELSPEEATGAKGSGSGSGSGSDAVRQEIARSTAPSDLAKRFTAKKMEPNRLLKKATASPSKNNDVSLSQIIAAQSSPAGSSASSSADSVPAPKVSKQTTVAKLRALIGRKAESSWDRYQLLEERDKILREGRTKISNVQKASALTGACPDMCPEKERYQREVQKGLSGSYEANPDGTVNHALTVKDYSRSSADQDVPLPHELRPGPVLVRTMDYLIGSIALNPPTADSQLVAWYDFLWNRTRAIRKDVTQQMLTDAVAVDLVEKCARIHVFAGHGLCHLDVADFDQRMNTENLTKSLQTLKHMYEDLAKSGMQCVNEPEFRAYDILLSLNDSNIFREVLVYAPAVRQHPSVCLALKIVSAVQQKNYVLFFRLVREKTTYLEACLCHRYFHQVRTDAIKILIKAYFGHNLPSVEDVVRMLAFETPMEALEFCSLYGLQHSPRDGTKFFHDKAQGQTEPDTVPAPRRSERVVEAKRTGTLGEILNGGPLDESVVLAPVNSFDPHSYYTRDPVLLQYLDTAAGISEDVSQHVASPIQPVRQAPVNTAAMMATVLPLCVGLCEEVVAEMLRDVAKRTKRDATTALTCERVLDALLQDAVLIELKQLIPTIFKQQRETLAKQKLERREKLVEECAQRLLDRHCEQEVKELVARQIRAHLIEARRRRLDEVADEICEDMIEEVTDEAVETSCRDVYEEDVVDRLDKLRQIGRRLHLLWLQRYWRQWLYRTRLAKERRTLLDHFPACPSGSSAQGLRLPTRLKRLAQPEDADKRRKRIQEMGSRTEVWTESSWEWPVEKDRGMDVVRKLRFIKKNLDLARLKDSFGRWRKRTRDSRTGVSSRFPAMPGRDWRRAEEGLKPPKRLRVSYPADALRTSILWDNRATHLDQERLEQELSFNHQSPSSSFSFSYFDDTDENADFNELTRPDVFEEYPKTQQSQEYSRRSTEDLFTKLHSRLSIEQRNYATDELRWKELLDIDV